MKIIQKNNISTLPLHPKAQIIFFEQHSSLIALNKPESIKSHPNSSNVLENNTLLNAPYSLKEQCYTINEHIKLYLLNRLDSPTSGVLLLTPNLDTANLIKSLFKEKKIQKTYVALVKYPFHLKENLWKDPLKKFKKSDKLLVTRQGKQIAQTKVELINASTLAPRIALFKLYPITGLTHQLRVQCALHNYPILGDKKYGDFKFNQHIQKIISNKRLFLHALSVQFSYIYNSQNININIKTNLPSTFKTTINKLFEKIK